VDEENGRRGGNENRDRWKVEEKEERGLLEQSEEKIKIWMKMDRYIRKKKKRENKKLKEISWNKE
jgi:hypothetical protein